MPNQPNIIFLLSDQQRYDTLGVLNPRIKTPHLDRLAASGMLLERAYPPTPVCLPCRASLFTGQYPSTHGATHNMARLPMEHRPLVAELLSQAGYFTHIIGKSHVNPCHDPKSPEAAPHIHDRDHYRRWHGPWYGFEKASINVGHSTEKHACGMHYGAWLEDQGIDTDRYFGHTTYEGYGTWDLPEQYHSSKWMADEAIGSIRQCSQSGRPFYLSVNFQDPHNPCYVPEPWASMYKAEDMPRFGFKPGEPESFDQKPPFYREILASNGAYAAKYSDPDMRAENVSHFEWTEQQRRENAAHYYGMVSLMDHHIGRILDALASAGQLDNTLVVFSSDHGDLLGDHGLWWKGIHAFEECLRVPMIASMPGRIPAGTRSTALQNLLDLAPTFIAAAGATIPTTLEGVNQWPSWEDPSVRVRSDTVVEHRPWATPWNQRILITDQYKLLFYANRDYGELYDMQADPDQIHNLYHRPEHRDLRDSLIRQLLSREMNKSQPHLKQSLLDGG